MSETKDAFAPQYVTRLLAEIDRQASTITALRTALEPFIQHYEPWMDDHNDSAQVSVFPRHTYGHLRAARKAYEDSK